ncbi:Orange carotenoid-binding protein [Stanieria cyanosphaera PCC 7437]|uniref:Orange carotenoid-binding protein n=1 Tax=Stanieria cyanosphaera (strain ATCC 29371 / PCC 7437) TaxID=111780 RepID=K9XWH1_STAC7|nr:orange carotenoid protein N-terminal domain-containing protein [Stanieria cyanosphaera]AFZ36878.1 Orange carotenoid-binding protein [Stanieria cyanosphaera PCC 7437]
MSSTKNVAAEKVYYLHSLEIDEQLAILWYVYRDLIKEGITPEAERPNENLEESDSLIHKIKQMSPEEQLQIQRDFIIGKNRAEFQTYQQYSSNQKLFFWYRLAQEMEKAAVVRVPDDYRLSPDGQQLLNSVKQLSFTNQLVFLRDVVGLSAAENS